jgi:hypothetical protein
MAVVRLPLEDHAHLRLLSGDKQDVLFAAVRSFDAAIAALKNERLRLLRAYRAEVTRKIRSRPGPS